MSSPVRSRFEVWIATLYGATRMAYFSTRDEAQQYVADNLSTYKDPSIREVWADEFGAIWEGRR